jgi:hypothetical protein
MDIILTPRHDIHTQIYYAHTIAQFGTVNEANIEARRMKVLVLHAVVVALMYLPHVDNSLLPHSGLNLL